MIFPLLLKVVSLYNTIKPLIKGDKEKGIKGLIQSKTVKAASASFIIKLGGIWVLPFPDWIKIIGIVYIVGEWLLSIYTRVITKGPVG